MASANSMRMTREEFSKKKELDELRKSGALEPEKDEDGKDINPHIPQYIAQAPWYLNNDRPGLKHQRVTKHVDYSSEWYRRGAKLGTAAEKFRKGACENCGAMTHKKADCTERPRKKGARFTNKNICPDEVVEDEFLLSYDGKRDRWNGYEPSTFKQVMKSAEAEAEERKRLKAQAAEEALKSGKVDEETVRRLGEGADSDGEMEELVDAEGKQVGQKFDVKTRTSVRNLRIREDTAKYLRNLDVNSALYDPKTRSMRLNPRPDLDPTQADFAGDNFERYTGDTRGLAELQLYEFGAHEKGQDVHLMAAPTQAQFAHEDFKKKKEMLDNSRRSKLLEKYGGAEHIDKQLPVELKYGQTERYVEYSRDGQMIKGQEEVVPKSKYPEDVFQFNHTAVWGSWWHDGDWGYSCCHSKVRNSFCTGEEGKKAAQLAKEELQQAVNKQGAAKAAEAEADATSRESRFKQAMEEEERRASLPKSALDERKRGYNSLHADDTVTEEDMEAYFMKRRREEDPMANFKDTDTRTCQ